MQVFEANLFCFQFFGDEASHAFPLAEYYNLFTFFADDVADNIDTFIHLGLSFSQRRENDIQSFLQH